MTPEQLQILHEHYRDSCTLMQATRAARDRSFYMVIATIAIVWFDAIAPQDFSVLAGELIKARLQLSVAPDLSYLRNVLWFLLLGFTVRYLQSTVSLERAYLYIHDVEAVLAKHVDKSFQREGAGYLNNYPRFSDWIHFLYVVVSPSLLLFVVVAWTRAQIVQVDPRYWTPSVWFSTLISLAIMISVVLYWVFLRANRKSAPKGSRRQR